VKRKKKIKSEGDDTVTGRMNFVKSIQMIEEQLKRQAGQDSILYNNAWMGLELDTNTPLLLESISRLASSHTQAPTQPQRLKNLNDIIFDAQTCNDTYHQAIEPLVESAGGTYFAGKVKDRERCAFKVENEYGGDARRLVDVIRGAGVFTSCTDMYKMVQTMESTSTISIIRCKDRINKPLESGYRDVILNISLKTCEDVDPQVAELQLRLKPIHDLYAQSHRVYEIQRILPDVEVNQSKIGGGTFGKWNKRKKLSLFVLICTIVALTTGLIVGLQTDKGEFNNSNPFPYPSSQSWTQVRHVPFGNEWHPATDNLAGTDVYGDPNNDSLAWSINFKDAVPNYNQFLFASGDGSVWLIATVDAVIGSNYGAEAREIISSSTSDEPYVAMWWNWPLYEEDPVVSIRDSGAGARSLYVYSEDSYDSYYLPSSGADVYVRNN